MKPSAPRLLAAFGLLAAAAILSPEFIAAHLSAHHSLGAYVAARVQALRLALVLLSAGGLVWTCLSAEARERLVSGAERFAGSRVFLALVFALGAAYLWTEAAVSESDPFAEGLFSYGAYRVLHGAVPCRDFFTYLFPGWIYGLALAFKVFGATLQTARAFAGPVPKFLVMALLYLLSRRLLERPAALAVAFFSLLFTSPNPDSAAIHNSYLALMFAAATLPALARFFEGGGPAWLAAAGLAGGLCLTVRQDFGLYVFLANAAALGLWLLPNGAEFSGRARARLWRGMLCYAAAWAAVVGGMTAFMLRRVPLDKLNECYVQGPLAYMAHYSSRGKAFIALLDARKAGLGPLALHFLLFDVVLLLTALAVGAGAWTVWKAWRAGRVGPEEKTLAALVFWCVFFTGYIVKGGGNVLEGVGPVGVLILVYQLARLRREPATLWSRRLWWLGAACLAGHGSLRLFFRPFGPTPQQTELRTPAGIYLMPNRQEADDLGRALDLIRREVPPGGRIYVHNPSKASSHVLFYFLAQRDSATRYHELFTGIATRHDVQQSMIRELSENDVARIVVVPLWGDPLDDELERFIRSRYEHEAQFGRYEILRKKT